MYWELTSGMIYNVTSIKIVQFSRPTTSFFHLRPNAFHPLDLGRPIPNESPSPNNNQLIKREHNQSINSLILSGFPLTSFHLAEASLSNFCCFILLCMQLSKNITNCLLFIIVNIFITHFAINLFCLAQHEHGDGTNPIFFNKKETLDVRNTR